MKKTAFCAMLSMVLLSSCMQSEKKDAKPVSELDSLATSIESSIKSPEGVKNYYGITGNSMKSK